MDEAVWLKHKDELVRYATLLVGPDAAEDVLSNVVLRVMRRRGALEHVVDPRSYLFKAVLNEGINEQRRRARQTAMWTDTVTWPPDVRPDVVEAVWALPTRQRAAVYLTYWRDLPIAEVAELMGCRPGTVKRYLHLARSALRERIHR